MRRLLRVPGGVVRHGFLAEVEDGELGVVTTRLNDCHVSSLLDFES